MTNTRQTILDICDRSDIPTEQKIGYIRGWAKELAPKNEQRGFSVILRDEGHWDICANGGREWRIRGDAGKVEVCDERQSNDRHKGWLTFKSVQAAFAFIADHYIAG